MGGETDSRFQILGPITQLGTELRLRPQGRGSSGHFSGGHQHQLVSLRDPLAAEEGMATPSVVLAGESLDREEPSGLQSRGLQGKSGHN